MFSQKLLPPYLQTQRWMDLTYAMDTVLENACDRPVEQLAFLNDLHPAANLPRDKITNYSIAVGLLNADSYVDELASMGLDLVSASNFYTEYLANLRSQLADFNLQGRGTQDIADFLSYTLNIELKISNLWIKEKSGGIVFPEGGPYVYDAEKHDLVHPTQDYSSGMTATQVAQAYGFSANDLGVKIFPTTFIEIEYAPVDLNKSISLLGLVMLLKSMLNYDLVFKIVTSINKLQIVPANRTTDVKNYPVLTPSDVIGLGALITRRMEMST